MDEFEKGIEDIPRTVTLSNSSGVLDSANFLTIEVKVFNWIRGIAGTYTLAAGTVTKLLPTSDGQIFFIVPLTTTANLRAIKYFYTVKTTETDVDYPGNIRTRSFLGWCFKLKVAE